MARVTRFEDLKAWQQARVLARSLYAISRRETINRDFAMVNQFRKTALSPMLNISEGFARRSDRDFAHFLSIAHGSVAEAQALLYAALDQGYIDEEAMQETYEEADHCSRLIQALGRYLGAGREDDSTPRKQKTPRTLKTP